MSENILTGFFKAKVKPIKPVNEEMTLCKCFIMALGKNNNKSNISKDAADAALPTLFGIPVVGHIYVDEDGVPHMGAHDMKIVKNDKGKYVFKMITVPYGFVPPQDDVHYEEVTEKDGTVNTYLVADIILWTGRYPELLETKYDNETYFHQSMEIKALESKTVDGYTDILKYRYRALCLLGKDDDEEYNQAPCFPSARVEAYCFSIDDSKLDELFEEFRNKIGECYANSCSFEEGGKEAMELGKINEILKEFNIEKPEDLPFAVTEDMTEERLREMISEMQKPEGTFSENGEGSEGGNTEDEGEPAVDQPEEEGEHAMEPVEPTQTEGEGEGATDNSFGLTANVKSEKLRAMAKALSDKNSDCYLMDYDDEFVYVEFYNYCGACHRNVYRIAYTENNTEYAFDLNSKVEVFVAWLTAEEIAARDKKEEEYKELVEFKENQLKENKEREYAEVISEFSDLSDVDEYKAVVGNALNFENAEALKEKLFAVRGRHGKFKSKSSLDEVKIPVENKGKQETGEDLETRFFSRYLPEALKK